MNLIDTHAHLYWDSFKDDFDEVIQRSINAGVTTVINVGVDVEKSKESLRQAQGILAEPFDETQGKLRRSLPCTLQLEYILMKPFATLRIN